MNESTILWVEDDYNSISAAVLPLTRRGVGVIPATSYVEAMDIIAKRRPDIALYLIDLILPHGGDVQQPVQPDILFGLELIQRMKHELHISEPILVFSVVYDPKVEAKLGNLGVTEVLQKGTFSNEELRRIVENALGG